MGPNFLFLEKKKENCAVPGEGRRFVSFAMVMDALAQAWNGKGAVMTVTMEMWKNSPM